MKDEEPLDFEVMSEKAQKLQHELIKVIVSDNEPSKELSTALIIALSNLLVMVATTVIPNDEMRTDVLVAAISRAMRLASQRTKGGKVKVYEIDLSAEAPGE
jgi:hypothetical protein